MSNLFTLKDIFKIVVSFIFLLVVITSAYTYVIHPWLFSEYNLGDKLKYYDLNKSYNGVKIINYDGIIPGGFYRPSNKTIYLSTIYSIIDPSTIYHEYCHYLQHIENRSFDELEYLLLRLSSAVKRWLTS